VARNRILVHQRTSEAFIYNWNVISGEEQDLGSSHHLSSSWASCCQSHTLLTPHLYNLQALESQVSCCEVRFHGKHVQCNRIRCHRYMQVFDHIHLTIQLLDIDKLQSTLNTQTSSLWLCFSVEKHSHTLKALSWPLPILLLGLLCPLTPNSCPHGIHVQGQGGAQRS
jgi:hypothetical protein